MADRKSKPITVTELPRSKSERLVIRLDEYEGTPIFQLRVFFLASDGRWLPGRKGIEISLEALPALLNATERAMAIALTTGRLS